MARRQAHTRTDKKTGKTVKVNEHEVRGPARAAGNEPSQAQVDRLRRQSDDSFEATMFYADEDMIDGDDDVLGTSDDNPDWGGGSDIDEPSDGGGFEEFDDGGFDLFDDDGGGGFGGGGHARNGLEYSMRSSMLNRGGGQQGQGGGGGGLKFNPEQSMIGRLLGSFGIGKGGGPAQ